MSGGAFKYHQCAQHEVEMREHMALSCGWTRIIWLGVLGVSAEDRDQQMIERWLSDMALTRSGDRLVNQDKWVLCMLTCWCIWKVRCKLAFEDRFPTTTSIIYKKFDRSDRSRLWATHNQEGIINHHLEHGKDRMRDSSKLTAMHLGSRIHVVGESAS